MLNTGDLQAVNDELCIMVDEQLKFNVTDNDILPSGFFARCYDGR